VPVPHFNVLNGGVRAPDEMDFQEFMIAPAGVPSVAEAVRAGAEVYASLRRELADRKLSTRPGDEGGFAPRSPEVSLAAPRRLDDGAGLCQRAGDHEGAELPAPSFEDQLDAIPRRGRGFRSAKHARSRVPAPAEAGGMPPRLRRAPVRTQPASRVSPSAEHRCGRADGTEPDGDVRDVEGRGIPRDANPVGHCAATSARRPEEPVSEIAQSTAQHRGKEQPPLGRSRADVLDMLHAADGPLGVGEVAQRMGLHPNTARFYLEALVEAGLAVRETEDRETPGRPRIGYRAAADGPAGRRRYRLLAEMLTSLIAGTMPEPGKASEEAGA